MDKEKFNFEEALQEIERIVSELEGGKVSLEEYWAGIDSYVNETIWATKMAPYI